MLKRVIIASLLTLTANTSFSQNFNHQRLDSLFNILEAKDKYMGSIAVSQNGKTLYTRAIGYSDIESSLKADTKTKYKIGSISKMFTAALILKAVEENKLSLDQTIDKYYPQIPNANKITITQLLRHRSGIHNFTNDKAYMTYNTQAKSEKEMIEIIAGPKSDFEPDTQSEYSNSNYVVLSYILQKLYGKPYADILKTKITTPAGLTSTYFGGKTDLRKNESYSYRFNDKWTKETETDPSIPMGAGTIVSTPANLTTFIEKLFAGKIVSDRSLDSMKTFNGTFGMGMFKLPYFEKYCYGHTGGIDGFQSVLVYFPEEKLSVALTSNGLIYANNDILLCALSCYFNRPFEIPTFKTVELKPEELDQFLGNYASTQIPLKIQIKKIGNKLFGQATGQSSFPLEAISANTFQFETAGVVIEFNTEKKQMTLKQKGQVFLFTKE
ncbi:serine hydrolase domain-containing protein [Chitinophaga flava]|uniref:Peptidase n=1 Tax=Chitinophaga flava TaxID=2259036 RepID=A0A365XVX1_9BACT|nr:serine hydrolase domain-containing protein [Chitinophaga flava]RBL90238.1 peptidase [Chitinophaga flava]